MMNVMLSLLHVLLICAAQGPAIPAPPSLKRLPDLDLCAADDAPNPIEGADALTLIGTDRIAFTRVSSGTLSNADLEGHVQHEIAWRTPTRRILWVGDERLLVFPEQPLPDGKGNSCAIWITETTAQTVLPFAAVDEGTIRDASSLPGRGCVLLISDRAGCDDIGRCRIVTMDAAGKLLSSVDLPHEGEARDAWLTSEGRAAIVGADVPIRVQTFERDGSANAPIVLDTTRISDEVFVSGVLPSERGGYLVKLDANQHSVSCLLRLDAQGKRIGEICPRWPNGCRLDWLFSGPGGRLWSSDRQAWMRVGREGIVDLVLGEPLETGHLHSVSKIVVEADGTVDAIAERDGSVHVFDGEGHVLRRIAPTDYLEHVGNRALGRNVHATLPKEVEWIEKGWLGPPRDGRHFEERRDKPTEWQVVLADEGKEAFDVLSRPKAADATWIPFASHTALDGSIAVLWRPAIDEKQHPIAAWYGPNGEQIGTCTLPADTKRAYAVAWDGKRLAVADFLRLWLFDTQGRVLADEWLSKDREYLPSDWVCGNAPDHGWREDFGAGGREVWCRRGPVTTVFQRYSLP